MVDFTLTGQRQMQLDLQYIDHPAGGERLVILPETQYRILELAAADGLAGLRKDQQEAFSLPETITTRISDGENPVRAIRQWRGLKGTYLAKLAGITPSMLSQIECTGKTGSIRTFQAIADALCVPVDVIFPRYPTQFIAATFGNPFQNNDTRSALQGESV